MPGKLKAIWIKSAKRGYMDAVETVLLVAHKGLKGNHNQGGKRQVTIIEQERWEEYNRILETDIPPSARRANFMISGIPLANSKGKTLKIGNCFIRIHGETKPCYRMNEVYPGLEEIMQPSWGGGAYGEVLNNCEIKLNDPVEWYEQPTLSF